MSNLFDKTGDALAASLQLRQLRHNITQSNIANAETPGFKAKKVDFEDALARAIETSDITALGPVSAEIYDNPVGATTNDGNTVDLEKEMTALTENSILYKSALQLINKKMAAVKYAISEGR